MAAPPRPSSARHYSYTVGLSYSGFTPSGSPTVYTLGNNATSITSATQSSASSITGQDTAPTVLSVNGTACANN